MEFINECSELEFADEKKQLLSYIEHLIDNDNFDFDFDSDYIKSQICKLIAKNKNNKNRRFITNQLISTINELISDEDYADNFDIIIDNLQYTFIEYNSVKGEIKEDVYCEKRVKAVLEELPNILFLKFSSAYDCQTMLEFIVSEDDSANLDLALKILAREKKITEILKDCNNYTADKVMSYIQINKIKYFSK